MNEFREENLHFWWIWKKCVMIVERKLVVLEVGSVKMKIRRVNSCYMHESWEEGVYGPNTPCLAVNT